MFQYALPLQRGDDPSDAFAGNARERRDIRLAKVPRYDDSARGILLLPEYVHHLDQRPRHADAYRLEACCGFLIRLPQATDQRIQQLLEQSPVGEEERVEAISRHEIKFARTDCLNRRRSRTAVQHGQLADDFSWPEQSEDALFPVG